MSIRAFVHTLLVPLLLAAGAASAHAQNPAGVRDRGFDDAPRAAAQAARGGLYILSVGVNTYPPGVGRLDYAVADADSFANALVKGATSLYEGTPYVRRLFNGDASRASIEAAFGAITDSIVARGDTAATFVFFYAGHGVVHPGFKANDSTFFLAPAGVTSLATDPSNWTQLLNRNGISHIRLAEWLRGVPAQHKIVLLDACQSGEVAKLVERDVNFVGLSQTRSDGNTAVFAATTASAPESRAIQHGVFTEVLLRSLAQITSKDGTLFDLEAAARGSIRREVASAANVTLPPRFPFIFVPEALKDVRIVQP